jgi:hypothetical protein
MSKAIGLPAPYRAACCHVNFSGESLRALRRQLTVHFGRSLPACAPVVGRCALSCVYTVPFYSMLSTRSPHTANDAPLPSPFQCTGMQRLQRFLDTTGHKKGDALGHELIGRPEIGVSTELPGLSEIPPAVYVGIRVSSEEMYMETSTRVPADRCGVGQCIRVA